MALHFAGNARPEESDAASDGVSTRFPLLVVIAAIVVPAAMVACSYALARRADPVEAHWLLWPGEIGLELMPMVVVIRSRPSERTARGAVALFASASWALTQAYAPLQLRFVDEYQHLWNARIIAHTGKLFEYNATLPVSSQYPGLDLLVAGISQMSGLPLGTTGVLLSGFVHVCATVAVYHLLRTLTQEPRVAVAGALLYGSSPHYQFFDAYYTYTSLGLCLMCWSLVSFAKGVKAKNRRDEFAWMAAAGLLGGADVVTHHVSSWFLIAFSVGVILVSRVPYMSKVRWAAMAGAIAAWTAIWDLWIARDTSSYFAPMWGSLGTMGQGVRRLHLPTFLKLNLPRLSIRAVAPVPAADRYIELVGGAALAVAFVVAALSVLRSGRNGARGWALRGLAVVGIGALLFATVGVRFGVPGGAQLSGRMLSYVLIPVVALLAVGYEAKLARRARLGGIARSWRTAGTLLALVAIVCGNYAASWPPPYARLPGPYRPGAWERSITPSVAEAARWISKHEPAGIFASDEMTGAVVAGYTGDRVSSASFEIVMAANPSTALARYIAKERVKFAVLDLGVISEAPASGSLFSDDPLAGHYASGVPRRDITKLWRLPGSHLVYDRRGVVVVRFASAL